MASYLLHTDNSSVPLVGDRMGPKCLFFGSGDDCGELGARPPGIEGWGAAGFIPCSMCCLLSSAQGGVSCLLFLAFALLQVPQTSQAHFPWNLGLWWWSKHRSPAAHLSAL